MRFPAAVQRFGAERAGARSSREVPTGSHAVAVSNPDVVAETIFDAVDAAMVKVPAVS
ncbi:MAG TPA: hypothetical protein VLJ59_16900 [Mycobacteriales bacterium]|nr:hypothetical protein [Mycobacteriales bacterium]